MLNASVMNIQREPMWSLRHSDTQTIPPNYIKFYTMSPLTKLIL